MNHRIKIIRRSNHLTQAEFGKRIGVSASSIASYESGARTPSKPVLTSICREFTINEIWLLTGEESPIPSQKLLIDKTPSSSDRSPEKTLLLQLFETILDELTEDQAIEIIRLIPNIISKNRH